MAEITRRSVLEECLKQKEGFLRLASKNDLMTMPKKGMEKEYEEMQQKCRILREIIQDYECPEVREAAARWRDPAKWQRDIMSDPERARQIAMEDLALIAGNRS